jgi:hypothetical protein
MFDEQAAINVLVLDIDDDQGATGGGGHDELRINEAMASFFGGLQVSASGSKDKVR